MKTPVNTNVLVPIDIKCQLILTSYVQTRMHSSRMCTARSLTASCHILCMPPRINHECPLEKNTQAPWEKPRIPPAANTHPSPGSNQAPHWEKSCTPPGKTMHTPRATMHALPVNRITDRCKNITFTNYVCGR